MRKFCVSSRQGSDSFKTYVAQLFLVSTHDVIGFIQENYT